MNNYFTYEVECKDRNENIISITPFNTHLESRSYFKLQSEEKDIYSVKLIRIKNGIDKEVLREHFNK